MLWLRRNAVVVGAVLSTAALIAIAGLAMAGSVLSRVHEIEGARGGTLTVVSLEGAPDLDPARKSCSDDRGRGPGRTGPAKLSG